MALAALRLAARLLILGLFGCVSGCLTGWNAVDRSATYTVVPGDTLYSISKRFDMDYRQLARRNRIAYPYAIYVGQQLYLWRSAPMSAPMPIEVAKRDTQPPDRLDKEAGEAAAVTAQQPGSIDLGWPLRGNVSSSFGLRGQQMHDGIDISAPEGSEVRASAAGEVVYGDRLSGYGKLIILRHGDDLFTAYAHNRRNFVKKGDWVQKGDVIASVGSTGRASSPHLHFEVRRGSTPVDPLAYLPRH